MYGSVCMIATLCGYDAELLKYVAEGKPLVYRLKPMFQIICCDAYEATQVFYELFDLLHMLNESLHLEGPMIHFALEGPYPIETIWTIQSYLYRHWAPYHEESKIENGMFYSTVFWNKIPITIQSKQPSFSK